MTFLRHGGSRKAGTMKGLNLFLLPLLLISLLTGCPMKVPNQPGIPQNPYGYTQPLPVGQPGTAQPVPAGQTGAGQPVPAGQSGAGQPVPAGQPGTGTSISNTVPPPAVTSGKPSSTAGSPMIVGPDGTNKVGVRNLDQRGFDLKWMPPALGGWTQANRDLVVNSAIAGILSQQKTMTVGGITVTNLRMELLGEFNNWAPSGTAVFTMFNDGSFQLVNLPVATSQGTPAIIGDFGGVPTIIQWVFHEGTTSGNIGAGLSWWSPQLGTNGPDWMTVKLWWTNSVLTSFNKSLGGRTLTSVSPALTP